VIGVCLAIIGFGMLQLGFGSRVISAYNTTVIGARTAADAGLLQALREMNLLYHNGIPVPSTMNGSGSLSNTNASYNFYMNNLKIDSTGTSGGETRIVHAYTGRESFFDYALFVTNDMSINNKTIIDGYNSDDGPYGGDNSGLWVEIGSNTTDPRQDPDTKDEGILFHSDVKITGNVAVGPAVSEDEIWGTGDVKHGVIDGEKNDMSGSAYALMEPYTWGNILELMPEAYEYIHTTAEGALDDIVLEGGSHHTIGNAELIDGTTYITPFHIIQCRDLNIKGSAVLEIFGDGIVQPDPLDPTVPVVIYVTRDLLMGQGAQILLTTGNYLQIFVGEQFKSPAEGSLLTNMTFPDNPRPKYFEIYGISSEVQEWTLGNSDTFYGVIYAPNANLTIHNSGEIFGSIAARNISLNNSGKIHYDLTLAGEAKYFAGYVIDRWWEEVVH